MKQAFFWKLAIATNICFLFLVVHKSSRSIQASYERQKLAQEKSTLLHRQEELTHKLFALKSLNTVKRYAHNELGMKTCTLKQVKQLSSIPSTPLQLANNGDNQPPINDESPAHE